MKRFKNIINQHIYNNGLLYLLVMFIVFIGFGIFNKYGNLNSFGDEAHVVNSVLKFFRDFNFTDPYAYAFPIMTILYIPSIIITIILGFIFGIISSFDELIKFVIVDTYKFLPIMRLTTMLFSLVTLIYFYKICLLIFNKKSTALIGVFLFETSFIFIKTSFIAVKWIPQLLLVVITFYFMLLLLKKEVLTAKDYIFYAILVAACYGVALIGLIVLLPFVIILIDKIRHNKAGNYRKGIAIFILVLSLLICILTMASPTLARNSFGFIENVTSDGEGERLADSSLNYRLLGYFYVLIQNELILFFLALMGALVAFKKSRFLFYILISYIISFYILLGPIFGAIRERRALLLIPVMVIFSLFFIEWITKRSSLSQRKILFLPLLFLLLNPLLIRNELLKNDAVLLVKKWVEYNIESNAMVFDGCNMGLEDSEDKIEYIKINHPQYLTSKQKFLLDNPNSVDPKKRYFTINYDNFFNENEYENIINNKNQYFIFCSNMPINNEASISKGEQLFGKYYMRFGLHEIFDIDANIKAKSLERINYFDKLNRSTPLYFIKTFNEKNNNFYAKVYKIN